jgi:hypothetical protein
MRWFISRRLDSDDEFAERVKFYEVLAQRTMLVGEGASTYYEFNDGRMDNRCMIIGHTDTATDVIKMLHSKSTKKYKFYLSVCEMYPDTFNKWHENLKHELFVTEQVEFIAEGERLIGCEFLSNAGFGFKATRSELGMYNSPHKGFFTKLDASFTKLK